MKTLQLFYLTLLIGAFIAHISCDEWPVYEIEIYEFQPKSSGGGEANEVTNVINAVSKTVAELEEKLKSDNSILPIGIVKQIENHNVREKLEIIKSAIADSISPTINTTNTKLLEVIDTLASVDSPFQLFPTIAVPILLALPTYVQSFLKKTPPKFQKSSKVACNLADTMKTYFEPTLLRRLIHINVIADNLGSYEKYIQIKNTAKRMFFEQVSDIDYNMDSECHIYRDDSYQQIVTDFENGFKMIPFNLMKDGLGKANTYYKQDTSGNSKNKCIPNYFNMVRLRLKNAFAEAYQKIQNLCTPGTKRTKKPTGRGLLTITVGAILGKKLADGVRCDTGKQSGAEACDPYLKITVGDTVHQTKSVTNPNGYISLDLTYTFPNLDSNAKILIEMLDSDYYSDETIMNKTYSIQELIDKVYFADNNYGIYMISRWQDEIEDSNFGVKVFGSSKNE